MLGKRHDEFRHRRLLSTDVLKGAPVKLVAHPAETGRLAAVD